METNFELKNITLNTKKSNEVLENNYDINFETNGEVKTIRMHGTGTLKETIKV